MNPNLFSIVPFPLLLDQLFIYFIQKFLSQFSSSQGLQQDARLLSDVIAPSEKARCLLDIKTCLYLSYHLLPCSHRNSKPKWVLVVMKRVLISPFYIGHLG